MLLQLLNIGLYQICIEIEKDANTYDNFDIKHRVNIKLYVDNLMYTVVI